MYCAKPVADTFIQLYQGVVYIVQFLAQFSYKRSQFAWLRAEG